MQDAQILMQGLILNTAVVCIQVVILIAKILLVIRSLIRFSLANIYVYVMSILLNQHTNLTLLIDKPFKLSIASDCYHNFLIHSSLVPTVYCKYFKPKYINVLIV